MGRARHKQRRKESNRDIANTKRNPNNVLNYHVEEEKIRKENNLIASRYVQPETETEIEG